MNTLRVFLFSIILILLFMTGTVSAWVDGYAHRMPIEINNTGNVLTNYQYNFTMDTATEIAVGNMTSDNGSDCCVADSSDVLLSFWNETAFNLSDTKIWVNGTSLDNVSNTTHYIYYGQSGVGALMDGVATYEFFDDFEDGNYNGWTATGGLTWAVVTDDSKVLKATGDAVGVIYTTYSFTDGIVEAKVKMADRNYDNQVAELCGRNAAGDSSGYSNCIYRDSISPDTRTNKIQKTHVATLASQTWNFNFIEWYNLKLVFNGTSIKSYINESMELSVTDASYASGRIACAGNTLGTVGAYFDNVRVRKYTANEPTATIGDEENCLPVPQWGNQSQNVSSISVGDSVLLSANGQDITTGLNYAWLSTNETGTWQNFTTVDGYILDYQMLEQIYLGTQGCCGSPRFTTGYSQVSGDYSKILFHHTASIPVIGQVISYGWYYVDNNTWNASFVVKDDEDTDASCLICCNDTRWRYSFSTIPGDAIYDKWTNDSGVSWTSMVASPFNGLTDYAGYQAIQNDTEKAWVYWVPTSDSTHVHQKFFYYKNESFGTETVAWTLSNNDRAVLTKILNISGTYYAYTSAENGYAEYRTSTNLINWSASISSGVPRYVGGWGYSVDCDDNYCYMVLQHTNRSTYLYSIDKALLNTTGWIYRLNLNVSNGGIPGVNIINNTHLIATNQENTAQTHYGMFVQSHTTTESKYGSPIKFDGSTNWEWANFTWSNSDYNNTAIGWKICFNDTSGLTNCTDVMSFEVHGDEPIITLLSQTPSIIYKNSTGYLNISYGISHNSSGLNNTSVSFIYRNYDWDLSDSNHSIRPPANDLASVWNFNSRILRATNRNETPGLNFENNDTITGGDTYTWSGLDENSTKLTIVPVSSTYTKIYINATIHCIMPQMWYLDRTDQQQATKTQLAIHKTSNVLIKFWNFEIYKGNYDFLGVGYTDTLLSSNPALWPSDANPVNFYYVNSSYDPATGGDPITSGYAVYMGSLNTSGWTDHVYSRSNSNYVRGFIDNNYLHTVINTTNISYLYFTSNTPSSHPFYINMTNAASSTNRSFANTNTLWAGNNPPYTPQLYTPNVWFAFMKLNMSLDHKLYVADNNDLWGSSSMSRTNITQALFPPTTPTINHFHFLGETDYDMDGVYFGNFSIGCGVSSDPDGGDVTHNLTLHYANNLTFVTIINNTFTDKDITHNGVYFDANFSSIPYYSDDVNYTLRLIATDDESESVTVWLNKCFTLSITPIITSYTPSTPTKTIRYDNQTFTININQIVNVTWYIDGSVVSTENNTNYSSYSNSTAPIDIYNVTAHVENINGTRQQVWDWEVEDPIYSALIQLQADIDDMKKVQTIIQALILLVIGVVVGVVSQRRRYNDEDSEKPIESKNN